MMYLRYTRFIVLFSSQAMLVFAADTATIKRAPIYSRAEQIFSPVQTAAYAYKNFYMVLGDNLLAYTPATEVCESFTPLTSEVSEKISMLVPIDGGKRIVLAVGNTVGEVCAVEPQLPSFLDASDEPDPEWPSSDDNEINFYRNEGISDPIKLLCATSESVFSATTHALCRWSIARRQLESIRKHASPIVTMRADERGLWLLHRDGTATMSSLTNETMQKIRLDDPIVAATQDVAEKKSYIIDTKGNLAVIDMVVCRVSEKLRCPVGTESSAMVTKSHAVFMAGASGDVYVYDTRCAKTNKVADCKAPITHLAYDRDKHNLYTLAATRDGHELKRHWMK